MHSHRASWLKQANKAHKSRYATKGEVSRRSAGRIADAPAGSIPKGHHGTPAEPKHSRKRKADHAESRAHKKRRDLGLFGPRIVVSLSLGGIEGMPCVEDGLKRVLDYADLDGEDPEIVLRRPARDDDAGILSALGDADVVLLCVGYPTGMRDGKSSLSDDLAQCVDERGRALLSLLKYVGGLTTYGFIQAPNHKARKHLKGFLKSELPFIKSVFFDDTVGRLRRALNEADKFKSPSWREMRTYLANPQVVRSEGDAGVVAISGFLRGSRNVRASGFVHIVGVGNFALEGIQHSSGYVSNASAAEPIAFATPDAFSAEQTWPTEQEMTDAAPVLQADGDSEDEDLLEGHSDEDGGEKIADAYSALRKRLVEDEALFPDEVETPIDVAARERFVKYRGLESFRTSAWHKHESLPIEYGLLHGLQRFDYDALEKKSKTCDAHTTAAGEMDEEDVVESNSHVTLLLRVPSNVDFPNQIGFLTFLHAFEEKQSLLHFNVVCSDDTLSVKSKDSVLIRMGNWSAIVQPIFSEESRTGVVDDKHKFERYLMPNKHTTLSCYGPIRFGESRNPVLVYDRAGAALLAQGTLHRPSLDRIILKRVCLSGYPFRVKKKWAVIRFMFFTPEDVEYFKSVELHTKHGARGRILEALGTHGKFKAIFDKPVPSGDTILLTLYKRVFPKPSEEMLAALAEDEGGME